MKYIVILLIAVGGYLGYQNFFAPPSEAFNTYKKFADALIRDDFIEAENWADGDALRLVNERKLKYKAPALRAAGRTVRTFSTSEIAGEVEWTKYKLLNETLGPKNTAQIEALQRTCRRAPNAPVAVCNKPIERTQTVTLEKDDQGWWVTSFSEN